MYRVRAVLEVRGGALRDRAPRPPRTARRRPRRGCGPCPTTPAGERRWRPTSGSTSPSSTPPAARGCRGRTARSGRRRGSAWSRRRTSTPSWRRRSGQAGQHAELLGGVPRWATPIAPRRRSASTCSPDSTRRSRRSGTRARPPGRRVDGHAAADLVGVGEHRGHPAGVPEHHDVGRSRASRLDVGDQRRSGLGGVHGVEHDRLGAGEQPQRRDRLGRQRRRIALRRARSMSTRRAAVIGTARPRR